MGVIEVSMERSKILADIYSRTFAGAISHGEFPEYAKDYARQAVKDFIEMMKPIDQTTWGHINLESFE